jgi:hypothetical protein
MQGKRDPRIRIGRQNSSTSFSAFISNQERGRRYIPLWSRLSRLEKLRDRAERGQRSAPRSYGRVENAKRACRQLFADEQGLCPNS